MFAFILELLSTTSTGWSSKTARERERERLGRDTDGLLTSLGRSWGVLDVGDAVKAEISGGGG